jgi:hypothetical protein
MVMARLKLRSLALVAPPALVALALGCRAIIGIDERQYNPLNCTNYCSLIMNECTGQFLQYPDMNSCLGLCSAFAPGTLEDISGDTLGCRLGVLQNIVELTDCPTAGPGGNTICGESLCQTMCDNAAVVCPGYYDGGVPDCMKVCSKLTMCPNLYYVTGEDPYPNDSSVSCRLYHLAAASADLPDDSGMLTPSQAEHCPHVIGEMYCAADAAPCGDAGD